MDQPAPEDFIGAEGGEDEIQDTLAVNSVSFNVAVRKGSHQLVFHCESDGNDVIVTHVSHEPVSDSREPAQTLYTGPVRAPEMEITSWHQDLLVYDQRQYRKCISACIMHDSVWVVHRRCRRAFNTAGIFMLDTTLMQDSLVAARWGILFQAQYLSTL